MHTIVMKFGGTSVADAAAIRRLGGIVRAAAERDVVPIVVVSAMAGVTDRLLALADLAARGERVAVQEGIDDLRVRHQAALTGLLHASRAVECAAGIDHFFDELRAMLTALAILREGSPRSRDGVAAVGELASSRLVASALAESGIAAEWVDARRTVITDDRYTMAAPLPDETAAAVQREIEPHLLAGRVPVLGGFVGATREGITTTLGRGGSDYSASIIGAAIGRSRAGESPLACYAAPDENSAPLWPHNGPGAPQARPAGAERGEGAPASDGDGGSGGAKPPGPVDCQEIQIWTDVDGMLTADPRIVNGTHVVPRLSFGEASELAYFGAKVLHPSTILPAVDRDIPVRILNSRRPDARGTSIGTSPAPRAGAITALACKRGVTVIEVTSTRMLMAYGFLRRLFEVFERHQTPVDVVTTSEVSVSVTVDDARHLDPIVRDLREFAQVAVEPDMALLCAVGDALRGDATVAVRLLGTLEGFPLRMVSQAASRRNLTCVVHEKDVAAAMTRWHDAWFGAARPADEAEPAEHERA